jgi:hypothetical protein
MIFLRKYICELVLAVNLLLIPFNHDFKIWWNKPVINDAFGYYVYLPAVFLYQDLNYNFMPKVWEDHYKDIGAYDSKGGFIVKQQGREVNKYPPGVAYYLSPFFGAAHITALITGRQADGYSNIYMWFVCIGAVFWQYFLFHLIRKIFRFYELSEIAFAWTVVLLSFGTNLYFYTQYFAAYSHLYSMISIALFFYGGLRFFNAADYKENGKYFLLMMLGYGLTIITRNMNGLCILLLPCMGFRFAEFRNYLLFLKSRLGILSLALFSGLIFSMVFFWYLQTGHWIIDSYPGEFFVWGDPQIFNSLFSAHKGWFFYTPVAFIAMFGFIYAPKTFRWNALLVLSLVIYIASAWYCWDYGTGYSMRGYIDWYILITIPLGFLIHNLSSRWYYPVTSICVLALGINLLFSIQFMRGIISGTSQGIEHFAEDFFRLRPKLDFKIAKNYIIKNQKFENTFDKSGTTSINEKVPFSEGLRISLPDSLEPEVTLVRFGAKVNLENKDNSILLCASIVNSKDSILFWQQRAVNDFVKAGKWERVESGFVFPQHIPKDAKIAAFFWQPKGNTVCTIDELSLEFIKMRPVYAEKK